MQLNKQKGDYECHFLAEIPTDPYRYKKGGVGGVAIAGSPGEITAALSQPVLSFAFCGAFWISSRAGKPASKPDGSRREGAGQTGVCVLLQRTSALNGPGIQQRWHKIRQLQIEARKVPMGNKLQVFNRASNYLPERRSRFTTFQVFQHRRGVFLKKLRSS